MGRLSKRTIQCRAARKQRDLKADAGLKASPRPNLVRAAAYGSIINFHKLGEDSLQRYQQAYGLGLNPGSSKDDLVWLVQHHFQNQQVVDEDSLLAGFVLAIKRDSSSESSGSF